MLSALLLSVALAAPAEPVVAEAGGAWEKVAEGAGTSTWAREVGPGQALFVPGDHALAPAWRVEFDGRGLATAGEPDHAEIAGFAAAVVELPGPGRLSLELLGPGPPDAAALTTPDDARRRADADAAPRLRDDALDAFAAGFYLFTGLYHLQLYRRRPTMRAYLWFALVCLAALGVDLTGILQRHVVFGSIWGLSLVNGLCASACLYAMLAFGAALVERPRGSVERGAQALLVLSGLAYGVAAPLHSTAWVQPLASLVWVGGLALFVVGVARAAARGNPEARLLAVGVSVFATLLAGGIAAQAGLLPGAPRWLPIPAFAALILSMALSLADRFERAHRELDQLRADLEERVAARTAELAQANLALAGFNAELADRVRAQVAELIKNRRLWRYFPKALVQRLLDDEDAQVHTERALLTVMFTDLTGFTTFSDGADPETVTATLNTYLEEMVAVVEAHGGLVDKVMGDGIMAVWGAPEPMPAAEQAEAAVSAGLAMQARMATLTEEWRAAGIDHPFRIRVGVHQDQVAVGSIGSAALRSFTVIGSGVNLASRLEGACPPGAVLVSGAVARQLPANLHRRGPLMRTLKGLRAPVETWELHVEPPTAPAPVATA